MKKKIKAIVSSFGCVIFLMIALFFQGNLISTRVYADSNWIDYIPEPNNYAYSFMVVGDTQYVTRGDPEALSNMYQWIADNAESKKVKHVFGVGDITHNSSNSEFSNAAKAIALMDGVVPYSLVRGNHDLNGNYFDTYFGGQNSLYAKQYFDCYQPDLGSRARNTVHEFSVENVDYLVLALDWGITDDVLEWANMIVEAYPHHTVIVTTHAYLSSTGKLLSSGDQDAPSNYTEGLNNGDDIWDKFIKKHENISMVLCGHVLGNDIVRRQVTGDNGNVITEMVINPQSIDNGSEGLTGMVATFYFSEDGKMVDVQWYSTVKQKFYKESNQFSMSVHAMKKSAPYLKVLKFGEGTVTPEYTLLSGESLTLSITPGKYFELQSARLNGKDILDELQNGSYVITDMQKSQHLIVKFVEEKRYLLVEQNDFLKGKVIYPNGTVDGTFKEGEKLSFKVEPFVNNVIESVIFNGNIVIPDEFGNYSITIEPKENLLVVTYAESNLNQDSSLDSGEANSSSSQFEGDSSQNTEDNNGWLLYSTLIALPILAVIAVLVYLRKKKKA